MPMTTIIAAVRALAPRVARWTPAAEAILFDRIGAQPRQQFCERAISTGALVKMMRSAITEAQRQALVEQGA
jgi:hypothetical protein